MSVISPGSDEVHDVELRAVTKRFGSLTAVDSVNLKVRKGEFPSLLGAIWLRQDNVIAVDSRLRAAGRR